MDINTIGLIILGLVGFGAFNYVKRKSSESINQNVETKEKDLELQKQENVIEAQLKVEEEKRRAIQEQFDKDTKDGVSQKDLEKFFGDLLNKSDDDSTKH